MNERIGICSLVTPADLFLDPDQLQEIIRARPGASLEELGLSVETEADEDIPFTSQPTSRFHGSVPGMVEEVKKLRAEGRRVIFAAPNLGEVERLADIFSEYTVPYRLGSRVGKQSGENFMDESAYATGDLTATTIVKAAVPYGFALPDASFVLFGAQVLFDDSEVVVNQPLRQKSNSPAFHYDLRDIAHGD